MYPDVCVNSAQKRVYVLRYNALSVTLEAGIVFCDNEGHRLEASGFPYAWVHLPYSDQCRPGCK